MSSPHRRESDFKVITGGETEFYEDDRQPSPQELPGVVHRLLIAFSSHRDNHKIAEAEFEVWRDDKLEKRIRSLEDKQLQSTTQIVTAGAVIGVIFTTAVTLIGLLSGILKWNL